MRRFFCALALLLLAAASASAQLAPAPFTAATPVTPTGGTSASSLANIASRIFSADDTTAKHDFTRGSTGAVSGTTAFSDANANFTGADVGKSIIIMGAGATTTIPVPAQPTTRTIAGCGTAAYTAFIQVTIVGGGGETTPSTEESVSVPINKCLIVNAPTPSFGALSWKLYASTTTGTETLQNVGPLGFGGQWQSPYIGTLVSGGASPPVSNTTSIIPPLITTIASVTDSHDIVLAAPAGQTASGLSYGYGTDDGPAIQTALTACSGGRVILGPYQYLDMSTSLSTGSCTLMQQGTPGAGVNGSKLNISQPALLLYNYNSTANTINLGANGALKNVAIMNPVPLLQPVTTQAGALLYYSAFAGTGVTLAGAQTRIENALIDGFNGCYSTGAGYERPLVRHAMLDCNNPLYVSNVFDVGNFTDINMHTFMPTGAAGLTTLTVTGVANNGSGACRLTVSSTSALQTGTPAYTQGIGGPTFSNGTMTTTGPTGCNGKFNLTVVDSTHVDLQGSQLAPTVTGYWSTTGPLTMVQVPTTANIVAGEGVSGTGVASGGVVMYVDYQAKKIYIPTTTAESGGTTLTFSNAAWSSGGTLVMSASHMSMAVIDTNDVWSKYEHLVEYGWETPYYVTTGSSGTRFSDADCDHANVFDPEMVCRKVDAGAYNIWWTGGNDTDYVSDLAFDQGGDIALKGVVMLGSWPGSVPISSINGGRLRIGGGSSLLIGGGSGSVGIGVGTNGIFGPSTFVLSGGRFPAQPLFDNSIASNSFAPSVDTALYGYLYPQGAVPNARLNFNGSVLLDQANETHTGSAIALPNGPLMDDWHGYLTNVAGLAGTVSRVNSSFPDAADDFQFKVTTAGTTTGSDTWNVGQPIEANFLAASGEGTANARPFTLAFEEACSVSGTYQVSLLNPVGGAYFATQYVLVANVPTYEVITIPGDTAHTWTLSGNTQGLRIVFPLDTATQPSTAGAWTGGVAWQVAGDVHLLATLGATCDIGNVALLIGTTAYTFSPRSPAQQLVIAQRYYRKTFPQGTAPAQNGGLAGALCTQAASTTAGTAGVLWGFPPMREPLSSADVTISTYNPSAANANWRDVTGLADLTVNVDPGGAKGGDNSLYIGEQTSALTVGHTQCIQATIDERL